MSPSFSRAVVRAGGLRSLRSPSPPPTPARSDARPCPYPRRPYSTRPGAQTHRQGRGQWLHDHGEHSVWAHHHEHRAEPVANGQPERDAHIHNADEAVPDRYTIHYRVRATNFWGTGQTSDNTFVVPATPPVVTAACGRTPRSFGPHDFWLRGTVNAVDAQTTTRIEYGPTTAYGTSVTTATVPAAAHERGHAKVPTPATRVNDPLPHRRNELCRDGLWRRSGVHVPAGVVRPLYMYPPTDR